MGRQIKTATGERGSKLAYDQKLEVKAKVQLRTLKERVLSNMKAVMDGDWDKVQKPFKLQNDSNKGNEEFEKLVKLQNEMQKKINSAIGEFAGRAENKTALPSKFKKEYSTLLKKLDHELGPDWTQKKEKVSTSKKRSSARRDEDEGSADDDDAYQDNADEDAKREHRKGSDSDDNEAHEPAKKRQKLSGARASNALMAAQEKIAVLEAQVRNQDKIIEQFNGLVKHVGQTVFFVRRGKQAWMHLKPEERKTFVQQVYKKMPSKCLSADVRYPKCYLKDIIKSLMSTESIEWMHNNNCDETDETDENFEDSIDLCLDFLHNISNGLEAGGLATQCLKQADLALQTLLSYHTKSILAVHILEYASMTLMGDLIDAVREGLGGTERPPSEVATKMEPRSSPALEVEGSSPASEMRGKGACDDAAMSSDSRDNVDRKRKINGFFLRHKRAIEDLWDTPKH